MEDFLPLFVKESREPQTIHRCNNTSSFLQKFPLNKNFHVSTKHNRMLLDIEVLKKSAEINTI